jgi:hypothetical protein
MMDASRKAADKKAGALALPGTHIGQKQSVKKAILTSV